MRRDGRKNILYFENAIGWGGAAICLKLLAEYLDKEKYNPIITTPHNNSDYAKYGDVSKWVCISDKNIDKEHIGDSLRKLKVTGGKYSAKIISLLDYMFNLVPYIFKVYRLARKENVDLIHVNNDPVCNMGGVISAFLLGVPCVSHVRGSVSWDSKTARWLYKKVDYVITVADWVKNNVAEMGVPEEKIETINDGRVLAEFIKPTDVEKTQKSLGIKPGRLSVGMVGLLIPWKGHKVFIEAAHLVGRKFPGCKIIIVGKAPDNYLGYEKELRELARKSGITNLTFAGHRDDVPDVMRALDVIVHASTEPDPYPNVVIEGMAAGKAVIASKIGGPAEMIADNQNGILIAPGNPQLLADKICSLLENEGLRLRLGREAQKTAFEKWSIETHMKKIQGVYEMMLGQPDA